YYFFFAFARLSDFSGGLYIIPTYRDASISSTLIIVRDGRMYDARNCLPLPTKFAQSKKM
ncbi:MAG: hypothetical protein ACI30J_02545, partial [Paludibacteraceae bacterium]